MTDATTPTLEHDELRPLMFSVAYRMLGSVAEAEDVVQDAFLRMHTAPRDDVRSPAAYATTVTTRLALDVLKSARRRRERYVGAWLPEPLVTAVDDDPAHRIVMDENVSMAVLTLLEGLSPAERAVFVLREAFGYEYADIAGLLDRSEASCRQLLRRAHQRLRDHHTRYQPSDEDRERLAERFFAAVRDGDLAGLEAVLAEDVEARGDGGGKAPAARTPVLGRLQVARLLLGLWRRVQRHGFTLESTLVNGQPGAVARSADGDVLAVLVLDIGVDGVRAVHNQINPDKLRHLGPVGDMTALLSQEL